MKSRFAISIAAAAVAFAAVSTIPVHAQRGGGQPADAAKSDAPARPTPRTADNHPDLSGVWVGGTEFKPAEPGKSVQILFPVRVGPESNKIFDEMDKAAQERQAAETNKPPYKPELLAKVADLSQRRQFFDGSFYCKPTGVPRVGLPSQIIQTKDQVVFLYQGRNTFRVIPIDGRPHRTDQDSSYMGDSVGHWEGDTLVVDVNNLTDESWLGADGWMHSDATHIVEKYRRDGDTLSWSATVDDPKVFTKPWDMTPRSVKLNGNPKALLEEDPPCFEQDGPHIVTNDHH
jgi:hypothetical protein